MQIEGLNPDPLARAAAKTPSQARDEAKLQEACQQFETLFLNQMLTQMRKTVGKSDFLGGGQSEEMFTSMLDEERAKAWSQDGGVGLAHILFQQMKETL